MSGQRRVVVVVEEHLIHHISLTVPDHIPVDEPDALAAWANGDEDAGIDPAYIEDIGDATVWDSTIQAVTVVIRPTSAKDRS